MDHALALRRRKPTASSPSRAHAPRLPLLDGAAAITLAGLAIASAALEPAETFLGVTKPFGWTAVGFIMAMTMPLAGRRFAPRTIALFTTSIATLAVVAGYPVGIGPFGAVFALHSLAYITTNRTTAAIGLPCGLALLAGLIWSPGDPNLGNVAGNGLFILFALAAGALLRTHNEQRAALTQKNLELTLAREAQVNSAVIEERLRIAREVHDAVGHTLVAITLQARVGQRRIAKHSDRAHDALTEIESLAQLALDDTRSAVVSIRSDHQSPGAIRLTAASLQALIDSMGGPDLDVQLDIDIGDISLDAELERTAFRIVQESLSNVAKHAGPSNTTIAVTSDGKFLNVEVANTGITLTDPNAGSGIRGMRERAEHLGGTLVAGPTSVGWCVHARLPVDHDRMSVLT